MTDREKNRFSARAARYAQVGAQMGGVAARMAGARLFGIGLDRGKNASELAAALGGLKGPIMKVAQLMATIPDLLPPEYAEELAQAAERGAADGLGLRQAAHDGRARGRLAGAKFKTFEHQPAAAASLGQVHRARASTARASPCKLQYADMQSAVEADLSQLEILFAIHRRMDPVIDTTEIAKEIGARVREELDYRREAKHVALYRAMLAGTELIRVPDVWPELSTGRLLTLDWLEGRRLLDYKDADIAVRNRLATAMFTAWWFPFSRFGVIHGDPHLGNYTVFAEDGVPGGINLLDYGCIRIFPPKFVGGVVDLYHGLRAATTISSSTPTRPGASRRSRRELIDTLNIWARFIYGPLLDDRVRTIADGVKPSEYGRREAFQVHRALKAKGPVKVPREFVFMDRAAIGLGGVFLHLRAEAQFLPAVQRGDRAVFGHPGGQDAGQRAGRGRPRINAYFCGIHPQRPLPCPGVCGKSRPNFLGILGEREWPTTLRSNTQRRTAMIMPSTKGRIGCS